MNPPPSSLFLTYEAAVSRTVEYYNIRILQGCGQFVVVRTQTPFVLSLKQSLTASESFIRFVAA